MRNNKYFLISFCAICGAIAIAFIVNVLFKIKTAGIFSAEWSAGDALSYVGAMAGSISTFVLSLVAYWQNEKLKEMVKKGAKMKTGIMKYHPSFIAQRKMQKEFQDKGYNDIFIPNLMVLSPQYAEYKKALDKVNDRMCRELGLHYDSNYNLVIKNLE